VSIIGGCVVAVFSGVVLAFWRWTGLKVIELEAQIVELKSRVAAIERNCTERLAWSRQLEAKLDKVAEDTSFIRGVIDEQHRGGRQR